MSLRVAIPTDDIAASTAAAPLRAARLLALAHYVDRAVRSGTCPSYSAAGKALGISQPHMAHIVKLLDLSPQIQAAILTGALVVTESQLRRVLNHPAWADQEVCLGRIRRPKPS